MIKNSSTGVTKRFTSKGIFPYQMAFTLLIPLRNIFLSPGQLIRRLELKADSSVLEVGPGPGYFSLKVAGFLQHGKLVLADIQKEMLALAQKRLDKKGIKNTEYYLCNGNKFAFSDNSFNRIFMVTVIGEVENKETYIRKFCRFQNWQVIPTN
ncbi:class I SAM-dependent methyltransferase [Maribellus comscasis]|uniref:class I SAM-dependent methyltransferase n=1 Tax=Maribellus comscasis TaxID=2681766 RepID=UPI001C2D28DD|nr:methyltransferase domain-containing protein [Maribellus comscasis]